MSKQILDYLPRRSHPGGEHFPRSAPVPIIRNSVLSTKGPPWRIVREVALSSEKSAGGTKG